MKDIKNYLHLYLGCEINTSINGTKMDAGWLKRMLNEECDAMMILRPLSDMTESEKKEMGEQKHKYDTGNPGSHIITDKAYQMVWALSKHFDIFGLIDSGLAIDKTKL